MRITPDEKGTIVPIAVGERHCRIQIRPPLDFSVTGGFALSGRPLEVTENGDGYSARLDYSGGGTMLVFDVDGR